MDREHVIATLREYLGSVADLTAVYLFGSVATGRAGANSDVDIGVLYRQAPARTLLGQPFEAEARLAERLGRAVQIVVMNDAPPDLVHRILRDGVLVLERDRAARVDFEVRLRNEWFDLQPILREYRRGAG